MCLINAADIEILGRCISCYRNKRSTEYCRMMKQHEEAGADVCNSCDDKQNNITTYHQQLRHDGSNATCKKKLTVAKNWDFLSVA